MSLVVALILRRMRLPLVALIVAYAVSIVGLVLVPGRDVGGQPEHMSFFHAVYFISYTATTIGFGELPREFSEAQRLWTIFSIYLTVIAWLYAIGKILALFQDPSLRQVFAEQAFSRSVRWFTEPFYIVCGHGETGRMLVRSLIQRGKRAVVIDTRHDRIRDVVFADYSVYVPGLHADASIAQNLVLAGLLERKCSGVIAVTDQDQANLEIAVTSKLLNPALPVSCRADSKETEANIASLGTEQVINPYEVFADQLALALHSPGQYLLRLWLTGIPGVPAPKGCHPPRGKWLLCGYGPFGKAVHENLKQEGIRTVVIEVDPAAAGCMGECIAGRGTEAETLLAAGIRNAAGIVAGTDNDANNLSIIMTARMLKPDLFLVARQNRQEHDPIFQAANLDLKMERSETVAREILALLATPLLPEFLNRMRNESGEAIERLVTRLTAVNGGRIPEVWQLTARERESEGLAAALAEGKIIRIVDLFRDPRRQADRLPGLALMLIRHDEIIMLPSDDFIVFSGDKLLLATRSGVAERMQWGLNNREVLNYLLTGEEQPLGSVWRWFRRHGRNARS